MQRINQNICNFFSRLKSNSETKWAQRKMTSPILATFVVTFFLSFEYKILHHFQKHCDDEWACSWKWSMQNYLHWAALYFDSGRQSFTKNKLAIVWLYSIRHVSNIWKQYTLLFEFYRSLPHAGVETRGAHLNLAVLFSLWLP